jgi:hypothetical protein
MSLSVMSRGRAVVKIQFIHPTEEDGETKKLTGRDTRVCGEGLWVGSIVSHIRVVVYYHPLRVFSWRR